MCINFVFELKQILQSHDVVWLNKIWWNGACGMQEIPNRQMMMTVAMKMFPHQVLWNGT
jgi:hypothetical protein